METRELICIGCPMGCPLKVEMDNGEVVSVSGNTCKRGDVYARKEVTNPTRIVTSSVIVEGGSLAAVSVKTKEVPRAPSTLLSLEERVVSSTIKINETPQALRAG